MTSANNINSIDKVSIDLFIRLQKPYREIRYFLGDNAYISINKNSILLHNLNYLSQSRIISDAIISVDYSINRLTIFSHETEQTIEVNFNGYVRW
jgi:hypothetical protein